MARSSLNGAKQQPVGGKYLLLALALSAPLGAVPQQATFGSGVSGSVNLSGPPYSTVGSWRIEGRLSAWTMPSVPNSRANVIAIVNGFVQVTITNNGGVAQLWALDFQDTILSNLININMPNQTGADMVFRLQKDVTNSLRVCASGPGCFILEVWNVNGSGYGIVSEPITRVASQATGALQIGDVSLAAGTISFVRWFSGLVAAGSTAPYGGASGDLGDWEFNGNGNDGSGHGNNLSYSPSSPSYSTTPTYPPACIMPPQMTVRAGTPWKGATAEKSYPLNGTQALSSYLWQQVGQQVGQQVAGDVTDPVTTTLQWSDRRAMNPIVDGLISGSYTLQLTVTDSSGVSNSCTTKYGAVATDVNGSVIINNLVHAKILGPMLSAANNPWPAYEAQATAYANLMIQKLQGTSIYPAGTPYQFIDYWNTAQAGTISVTHGSSTVTGTGTAFQSLFCGGGTTPVMVNGQNPYIVVWYVIGSNSSYPVGTYPAGTTGRRIYQVSGCPDDTHLVINIPYNVDGDPLTLDGSGLSYAYVDNGNGSQFGGIGPWLTGNFPGNYYDDVKALYAQWYRTGIDDYLYWAQVMADRWWSYPYIDKGVAYDGTNGRYAQPYRSLSMTGLFLRAADTINPPPYSYFPGLAAMTNYLIGTTSGLDPRDCRRVGPVPPYSYFGTTVPYCPNDIRDQSYAALFVALDALTDPDPVQAGLSAAAVDLDIKNRWGIQQQPTGNWLMWDTTGYATWANTPSQTATVTVGSSTVTSQAGTDFSPGNASGNLGTGPYNPANAPAGIWFMPNDQGILVNAANSNQIAPFVSVAPGNPSVFTFPGAPPEWLTASSTVNVYGLSGSCAMSSTVGPYPVSAVDSNSASVVGSSSGCIANQTQPLYNSQGDSNWYYACYSTSTPAQIRLCDVNGNSVPYKADTACPSGSCVVSWEISGLLGGGTQPFMVGIQNTMFYFAQKAIAGIDQATAALLSVYALSNANWMATTGLNFQPAQSSSVSGLYYGRGFISCEPPGAQHPFCDSGLGPDRELNGEGINVATFAYLMNPTSPSTKTLGDVMMSALWAWNPGDRGYDGLAPQSDIIAPPGFFYSGIGQHKWFGYYWGVGANWAWASARLGGLRPPMPRVVQASLEDFQGATTAVVTVISPDGTTTKATCTSLPCPVTIDARQGDHLAFTSYLDSAGKVLRRNPQPQPLRAQ